MGFQGMTAHWIEVKDGKWKMRAAVIGFKGLSGAHDGDNLGKYSVGLLDRVGIMNKTGSKACRFYFFTIVLMLLFPNSFIRQHWITPETITRPARLLSAFIFIAVSSGTVVSNSCRMFFFFKF
jgi:hypothetical protein